MTNKNNKQYNLSKSFKIIRPNNPSTFITFTTVYKNKSYILSIGKYRLYL